MLTILGIGGVVFALAIVSERRPRISWSRLIGRKDRSVITKRETGAHRIHRAAQKKGRHWATAGVPSGFSFGNIAHVSFKWLFSGSRPSAGVSQAREAELKAWDEQESRIARLTGRHRASGVLAAV